MKLSRKKWMVLLAVTVLLLPVAYVLSGGPMVWVAIRYPASQRILLMAIRPIDFAERHSVFKSFGVNVALDSYYGWWEQKAYETVPLVPALQTP